MISSHQSARLEAANILREIIEKLHPLNSLICMSSDDRQRINDAYRNLDAVFQRVLPPIKTKPNGEIL